MICCISSKFTSCETEGKFTKETSVIGLAPVSLKKKKMYLLLLVRSEDLTPPPVPH